MPHATSSIQLKNNLGIARLADALYFGAHERLEVVHNRRQGQTVKGNPQGLFVPPWLDWAA
jgi:hypothetical protein